MYTGEIKTNDRSVLPSKLELDVYLPELSLAIEVNGPTHYQPIYGEESLKATINRDKLKAAECKSLGITLIVLDISERHYSWRDARIHLESLYAAQVKSLVTG